MTQLQEIKLMNETMIVYLKKTGQSSKRNEIISNILKDDACFFKINKDDAFMILEDVGISKDKINNIYLNLISSDTYYYLKEIGKINENDKNILVKYKNYNYNELFQNKNTEKQRLEYNNNLMIECKENFLKKIIDKIKKFFKFN